jgi:hypothetical protein
MKHFRRWDIEADLIKSNMPKLGSIPQPKIMTKLHFLRKANRELLLHRFPSLSKGVRFPKVK